MPAWMTQLTFALNYNKIDVSGVKKKNDGDDIVPFSLVQDIENNYPNIKLTLTSNTALTDKMGLMGRIRYFGSHYDDQGTIKGTNGASKSTKIKPTVYLDLEYNWQVKKDLNLVAGVSNVLDTFPTKVEGDEYSGYHSSGFDYAQFAASGYEGGSWYLKGVYTF